MSRQIVLQKMLVVSLVLSLSGLALALEGFYFAAGTGGTYTCLGGQACYSASIRQLLYANFWLGIYLLLPGLVLIIAGGLVLRRIWRRRLQQKTSIFQNRTQKRFVLSSALLAFMLILFFLAPIVPFNTTFRDPSTIPIFPRVDVCYQNTAVHNPVQVYSGLETPSHALFGVGNFVYVQCTVASGT
jgi:Zn-dependent protease